MNHFKKLIKQYLEWKGYIVRSNVKVGRLPHGGYAGELDIVAYHPQETTLLHIEPSLDALPWEKKERRFSKKFKVGEDHICKDIFPWLSLDTPIEQIAVIVSSSETHLNNAKIIPVDQYMKEIKKEITDKAGKMASNAIPEQYDLLRTIQMAICGYNKPA